MQQHSQVGQVNIELWCRFGAVRFVARQQLPPASSRCRHALLYPNAFWTVPGVLASFREKWRLLTEVTHTGTMQLPGTEPGTADACYAQGWEQWCHSLTWPRWPLLSAAEAAAPSCIGTDLNSEPPGASNTTTRASGCSCSTSARRVRTKPKVTVVGMPSSVCKCTHACDHLDRDSLLLLVGF